MFRTFSDTHPKHSSVNKETNLQFHACCLWLESQASNVESTSLSFFGWMLQSWWSWMTQDRWLSWLRHPLVKIVQITRDQNYDEQNGGLKRTKCTEELLKAIEKGFNCCRRPPLIMDFWQNPFVSISEIFFVCPSLQLWKTTRREMPPIK